MKRNPNASTISQERDRADTQNNQRNIFRELKQTLGVVSEVHPTLPLVKVNTLSGQRMAGGAWLGVGHSVLDIIQRFGALRPGLRANVQYSGEVETTAIVNIIGVEGERFGIEINQANDFDSNFPWRIFTPGIGI